MKRALLAALEAAGINANALLQNILPKKVVDWLYEKLLSIGCCVGAGAPSTWAACQKRKPARDRSGKPTARYERGLVADSPVAFRQAATNIQGVV